MTTVSKRFMAKQLEEKVYQTFWETIVKINRSIEANLFFSDLFTKNERINFTKRLAIVVLLHKNYEWRDIEDLLKVSPNTIAKVAGKVGNSGFKLFFEKIEKEANWHDFWRDLAKLYLTVAHGDKVARLGMEGVENIYLGKRRKTNLL